MTVNGHLLGKSYYLLGKPFYGAIITLGWRLNTSSSPLQSLTINVALRAFVILAIIGLKRNIYIKQNQCHEVQFSLNANCFITCNDLIG